MAANERLRRCGKIELFLVSVLLLKTALAQLDSQACPKSYPEIFDEAIPRNGTKAGIYTEQQHPKGNSISVGDCIYACCQKTDCNIIVYIVKPEEAKCFHVTCNSSAQCLPVPRKRDDTLTQVALIRPVEDISWPHLLSGLQSSSDAYPVDALLAPLNDDEYESDQPTPCEVGVGSVCGRNERCVAQLEHSRHGICTCARGFIRNSAGDCIDSPTSSILSRITPLNNQFLDDSDPNDSSFKRMFLEGGSSHFPSSDNLGRDSTSLLTSSTPKPMRSITVSARNKTVQLPENKVKLSAYTVPLEKEGEHFTYEWVLLSKPGGEDSSGTMNNKNGATVELSNLSEGLYTFNVSVRAQDGFGSTLVNVTVLPPKRINQLPVVIVTPVSQIVKSPNHGAVLDGSSSTDDEKIVKWHWELQQGPLDYKSQLQDTPTLQLDNLYQPGNYTFKLTVTDSDGATNSTTANITVVASKDYPPEANAGADIIVHLPQNNVTLNGSLSSDDHGITSWEWTKSASDQNKAVDMQNTRTPYLQLSNLELGMYTFTLKVMDTSNQSSKAVVHVFVKPPTSNPPVVDAGPNVTLALPQNWAFLDASKSTDDNKIVGWKWEEIRRPPGSNSVTFSSPNKPQTNVTDLTKGEYEFHVTVTDENNNNSTGSVFVTVTQNKNAPPKANAGGDQTVILPISVVTLNGSHSSDDLGIVSWKWTREPDSLAIGRVLGNSDSTPILMLTDVVPGRYVFRLKVTDEQGSSSEDTVSVIVKPDPLRFQLVELTLNIVGEQLTKSQEDSLSLKLSLLLPGNPIVQVRELREEHYSGRAQMLFYVEDKSNKSIIPGPHVVSTLKTKLEQDVGLLELSVANIQTEICQNNCSGHGVCDKVSRLCLCEAFWMQNLIRKYFGDKESNCDWSILYVIIGLFLSVLVLLSLVWGIICLCQKVFSPKQLKIRKRYTPVDSAEEDSTLMIPKYSTGPLFTDSDTDSDVMFENQRGKLNGDLINGAYKKQVKNGVKWGRRIKT
ncbi:Dyslexia-associated protein KIAA0319-like protein [Frankliniella fusca]|uniref:Dyslexia-associated protein KIAA0319-like protein n=1 Tax=Frankliniella fusca TaxID=407009 RepID=A0AAE1HDY2_9NEOP|nr:Dyslexia-associated protein KIAA0319-like protein [Frankliniella fusca]